MNELIRTYYYYVTASILNIHTYYIRTLTEPLHMYIKLCRYYSKSIGTSKPLPKNPHNGTYNLHRINELWKWVPLLSVSGIVKKFGNNYAKNKCLDD